MDLPSVVDCVAAGGAVVVRPVPVLPAAEKNNTMLTGVSAGIQPFWYDLVYRVYPRDRELDTI